MRKIEKLLKFPLEVKKRLMVLKKMGAFQGHRVMSSQFTSQDPKHLLGVSKSQSPEIKFNKEVIESPIVMIPISLFIRFMHEARFTGARDAIADDNATFLRVRWHEGSYSKHVGAWKYTRHHPAVVLDLRGDSRYSKYYERSSAIDRFAAPDALRRAWTTAPKMCLPTAHLWMYKDKGACRECSSIGRGFLCQMQDSRDVISWMDEGEARERMSNAMTVPFPVTEHTALPIWYGVLYSSGRWHSMVEYVDPEEGKGFFYYCCANARAVEPQEEEEDGVPFNVHNIGATPYEINFAYHCVAALMEDRALARRLRIKPRKLEGLDHQASNTCYFVPDSFTEAELTKLAIMVATCVVEARNFVYKEEKLRPLRRFMLASSPVSTLSTEGAPCLDLQKAYPTWTCGWGNELPPHTHAAARERGIELSPEVYYITKLINFE